MEWSFEFNTFIRVYRSRKHIHWVWPVTRNSKQVNSKITIIMFSYYLYFSYVPLSRAGNLIIIGGSAPIDRADADWVIWKNWFGVRIQVECFFMRSGADLSKFSRGYSPTYKNKIKKEDFLRKNNVFNKYLKIFI